MKSRIFTALFFVFIYLNANSQTKCIIGVDTFKLIGKYEYNHNYFTEDTIIKKGNIKTFFDNVSDGKYYFKYDTSLCAFTFKNGFFEDKLYYFDGNRLTLYNEYINNVLQVKYICWGRLNHPLFDVSIYKNGNRKMYIKQNPKKPYIITLNKKTVSKTYFIKRKIKTYFNIQNSVKYPVFL